MQQRDSVLEAAQSTERRSLARQLRKQPQHRARHDAERPLRADEELLQVVARVVLQHLVERAHDRAVREHGLETEHEIAHHPEADHLVATGIGRDVAADRARAARSQIQRKQVARVGGGLLHHLQGRAGEHRCSGRCSVDFLDARHPFHRDRNLALLRRCAARQTRHPALHADGCARGRARLENRSHVGGGCRPHYAEWSTGVLVAEVDAITRADLLAGQDGIGAQRSLQVTDDIEAHARHSRQRPQTLKCGSHSEWTAHR